MAVSYMALHENHIFKCLILYITKDLVNFPFLDGDVPRSPSYGVYISQLIRSARVCSNVDDFNDRNLFLTAKLLKQGYIS